MATSGPTIKPKIFLTWGVKTTAICMKRFREKFTVVDFDVEKPPST